MGDEQVVGDEPKMLKLEFKPIFIIVFTLKSSFMGPISTCTADKYSDWLNNF